MMYLTFSQLLQLFKTLSVYSAADAKREVKEQWHSINWEKAYRTVKSLQTRIVAAIKENRWGKVKSLQWILTHSFSAKVIAIKRVTENKGSRTSGIDGETWSTRKAKWNAIGTLKRRGYKASAVKRIKIPKDNGKYRMLGIPTMRDRAMQALYLLALEPVAETTADIHSYGFRPYRNCHDAIEQCHILLSRKDAPQYILEGDIRACFDKINHQFILENIPTDKQVLGQWLKAGFTEKKVWYPSEEGTPQGSIISPTISNMILDGMAKVIDDSVGIRTRYYENQSGRHAKKVNNSNKINFVRYADDWIVVSKDKDLLEKKVKPAIEGFLKDRGLELSDKKTVITNIYEGFDFLGQNIRKYKCGKLLIKPSKKSVKKFLTKIRLTIKELGTAPAYVLVEQINLMTKGWTMYHRHCAAKKTFSWVDHQIWKALWSWCIRRHRNKGKKWVARKYFTKYKEDKLTFFDNYKGKTFILFKLGRTPIIRYSKIRANLNPFVKEDEPYFEHHIQKKMLNTWRKRQKLTKVFRRQDGKCPICQQQITKESGWNLHHKVERYKGGKDTLNNLVMLHPNCHQQVHYWNIRFDGDVPIGAFESA